MRLGVVRVVEWWVVEVSEEVCYEGEWWCFSRNGEMVYCWVW